MGLFGVLIVAVLGWLVFTGRIGRPSTRQMGALIVTLVGGAIALRGSVLVGGGMAIAGLAWLMRSSALARRPVRPIMDDPRARDALDLLGLAPGADRAAVVEAHRRLIARNHPDVGGTEALARSINAARDCLLGRLPR